MPARRFHTSDGPSTELERLGVRELHHLGRYANADHYQMLAYCTALQVPRAWLVYAAGSGQSQVRRIKNTKVEIVEYPLDLAQPPRLILDQIGKLVEVSVASLA
ncbi:MAG: McrC family protein [Microlunatus sp.]|nr:McrC family protein [Microlunatus sp.]MDN5769390.1 McrC family protein [Microlunatus sp.]